MSKNSTPFESSKGSRKKTMLQLIEYEKKQIPDCFIGLFKHKNIGLHGHNCLEFVYVMSGTCNHMIYQNGKPVATTRLEKGSYLLLDDGPMHLYRDGSDDFTIMNLLFYSSFLGPSFNATQSLKMIIENLGIQYDNLLFDPTTHVFKDRNDEIKNIFQNAYDIYSANLPGTSQLMRCKIIEILILSLQNILQQHAIIQPKESTIADICKYVDSHYMEQISLTNICSAHYYSISYICRKFKKVCGISFEHYLQNVRIENACQLLLNTNLTIGAIAETVGYTDLKSFRTTFQKNVGVLPSNYRSIYHANS